MKSDRRTQAILTLFGISAGVATGLWLWRRGVAQRQEPGRGWATYPRGSAQDVADSLRQDPKLGGRRIEVDTIAEGVVELSGSVRDRAEAERAVGIAQATTGVYTVVNRLTLDSEESHRSETRRRWKDGAPDLRERHHYGMGVGMGARRQSPATDPDRPSDKQKILERELDVPNVDSDDEVPTPDPNTASRVESTPVKPGDERTIEEAGLNPRPDTPAGGAGAGGEEGEEVAGEEGGSRSEAERT